MGKRHRPTDLTEHVRLGALLRGLREKHGLTQVELAGKQARAGYLVIADLFKDPVSESWRHSLVFGLASGVGAVIVCTRFLRHQKDSSGT